MGAGKDFEDALCDGLEEYVGDEGVVLLRRQSWSMRRGQFAMSQECDILCDSARGRYYLGIEAKTLDISNSKGQYGFYFSQLPDTQFTDELEYAEKSGRTVFVCAEARNYRDDTAYAWAVPLDLFVERKERGDSKVSWDDIERYGYLLGTGGTYQFDDEVIDHVERLGTKMRENFEAVVDADE